MDRHTSPEVILKGYKLRNTACRVAVLNVFLDRNEALSHGELEEQLRGDFDRATVYRTLNSFYEKDIVHKVYDASGAVKFALCVHSEDEDEYHTHDHNHVHFNCTKCGKTICLDDTAVGHISLPAGYIKEEVNFVVIGKCFQCS